jgi:hypothetical protein
LPSLPKLSDLAASKGQLGQFGPHRISALNAHWREDDLPGPYFHVKVLGRGHSLRDALGQGELIFGSNFGQHGIYPKVRNPYFTAISMLRWQCP